MCARVCVLPGTNNDPNAANKSEESNVDESSEIVFGAAAVVVVHMHVSVSVRSVPCIVISETEKVVHFMPAYYHYYRLSYNVLLFDCMVFSDTTSDICTEPHWKDRVRRMNATKEDNPLPLLSRGKEIVRFVDPEQL